MAIVVVGGSGRGAGKTSFVRGLIAALPEYRWNAVKITHHVHGERKPFWEETEPGEGTDTARYLAAGAQRAFLVTAGDERLPIGEIRATLGSDANVIFESNRIVGVLDPNLCIGVIGGSDNQIKPSFESFLERADALVIVAERGIGDLHLPQSGAKVFQLAHCGRVSAEMLDWLRLRLDSPRIAERA
jgi:hypothetical protein